MPSKTRFDSPPIDSSSAPAPLLLCLDSCGDSALLVIAAIENFDTENFAVRVVGHTTIVPTLDSDRVGAFLEALQQLMTACEADFSALHAAMIVVGPGRFTGMRMGMAMMQGIATPDIPLRGVRRDLAYRSLLHGTGMMVMESGKSAAFVASTPFTEAPVLSDATQATQCFSSLAKRAGQPMTLLSLLARDEVTQHYAPLLSLVEQGQHHLIIPDDAQRANALAQSFAQAESPALLLY